MVDRVCDPSRGSPSALPKPFREDSIRALAYRHSPARNSLGCSSNQPCRTRSSCSSHRLFGSTDGRRGVGLFSMRRTGGLGSTGNSSRCALRPVGRVPAYLARAWRFAGGRPGPGAPAKACVIAIHSVAAGPSMARARSSRCLRWVTSRQKSRAGPVIRSSASAGPQAHRAPSGAGRTHRTGPGGWVLPRTA